jgi:hypothetical protein
MRTETGRPPSGRPDRHLDALTACRRRRRCRALEPLRHGGGVEADEPADLHVRDPMFGDEPADVALARPERCIARADWSSS